MLIMLYVGCISDTPSEQPHKRQGAVQHHGQHPRLRGHRKRACKHAHHSLEEGEPPIAKLTAPARSPLNGGAQPPACHYLCISLLGDVVLLERMPVLFAEAGRTAAAGLGLLRAVTGARPVAN